MQLRGRIDIEAPIAFVYDQLSDFAGWETAAMRRGAEVTRRDSLQQIGAGMVWSVGFSFRGKARHVVISLTGLEVPSQLVFSATAPSMAGTGLIDLVELAARRTRLSLEIGVKPATLGARLFVQSMKLARGRTQGRLDQRLKALADDLESRYRRSAQR